MPASPCPLAAGVPLERRVPELVHGHGRHDQRSPDGELSRLGGLALNVAFIAGGAATFLAAWVLRRSAAKAVAGPLLLGFFGCTSVVSGLVDTTPVNAPATAASQVHELAGVLGFLAAITATFVFARRFGKEIPPGVYSPGRRCCGPSPPRLPSSAFRSRLPACSGRLNAPSSPPG